MTDPTVADVTVVIPAYNAEWCIADAIRSVLDQTRPPREIIIVIDGASDRTLDVVRGFGSAVTVVEQPNAGVSAARNRGISMASGRYVAFLDADDIWLPEKLARQVGVMERDPDAGLIYTAYGLCDADLESDGQVIYAPPEDAVRNTLLLEPPGIWVSSTCLFPTSVLDAVGGFDERMSTSADTDLAVRIGLQYPVSGVPIVLALYRQHGSQMHHDPDAMAHDMEIVYRNVFSSPLGASVRSMEGRAWANLHATLALAYASRGQLGHAAMCAVRAVSADPRRSFTLAQQVIRHRSRRSR